MNNWKGASLFLIAMIALLHAGNFAPQDPDLGLHLSVGKIISEEGQQPQYDPFTYTTEGTKFINFEWAFDWASYALFSLGGGSALWFAKILILVLILSLLFALYSLYNLPTSDERRKSALWLVALLLFSIPVMRYRFVIRPHLIGYLMLLLHLWLTRQLVSSISNQRKWVLGALLVGTLPLWAAMHGSWPLAFGVGAAHLIVNKEHRKHLILILALELLVLLPNPHGLALLWVPFEHLGAAGGGPTPEEWMAPDLVLPTAHLLIFYACFALFALVFLFNRSSKNLPEVILAVALALLATRMARFVTPALLVLLPLTAAGLSNWMQDLHKKKQNLIHGIALLVGLTCYFSYFEHPGQDFPRGFSWNTETMPRAAAATIREHKLPGRIFNDFDIGDDLCWTLGTANPHAIDGRVNLFGSDGLKEYIHLLNSPEAFEEHVQKYDVQLVLLQWSIPRNQRLVEWLTTSTAYRLIHMDARYAVWARDNALEVARQNGLIFQKVRLPAPPFDLTTMIVSTSPKEAVLREMNRVKGAPLKELMELSVCLNLAQRETDPREQETLLNRAEKASSEVIEHSPTGRLDSLYARLRRGQALMKLKRYEEAQADFMEVLKYMDHPEASSGLERLKNIK